VLEFRPRLWQIVVSWLLFAVCLVLAAWLSGKGHDTFLWVLGHDAVQARGAAALVVGGVAALITVLVSRRWTSELQVIAVDLLDETIHHASVLSQLAAFVLFGRSGSLANLTMRLSFLGPSSMTLRSRTRSENFKVRTRSSYRKMM
jgi:hypothetical protein